MNKKSILLASLLVMVLAGSLLAAAQQAQQTGTLDKYLSAADIQAVTGFTNVKLSQSSQKGLTGNLHFVNKDGRPILVVKILRAALYKRSEAQSLGLIKGDVKGIGEDAYFGPNIDTPYILSFKKGERYVELSTLYNKDDFREGKLMPFISIEQLEALGKLIASRI